MKYVNKDPALRIRLRAGVAYPAVSVALAAAVALAFTSFGPSQVMALGEPTTPLATIAPSTTTTAAPSTTTTAAPSATTTAAPSATTTAAPGATATTSLAPTPLPSPSSAVAVAPANGPVDHHVLARIDDVELQANYLPLDAPVPDASQFQTFRVRFKLHNAGTTPMTATPRLEYRPDTGKSYVVVPEKPQLGKPFHVTREWIPSLGLGGGTMQSPLGEDIAVVDLKTGSEGGGTAVSGHRSMGANPDRPITLPAGSYTEQEFTVTLSIDAQYLTGYQLRITDGGTALTGTQVAEIRLGPAPAIQLSPGQHEGIDVGGPQPAKPAGGSR